MYKPFILTGILGLIIYGGVWFNVFENTHADGHEHATPTHEAVEKSNTNESSVQNLEPFSELNKDITTPTKSEQKEEKHIDTAKPHGH